MIEKRLHSSARRLSALAALLLAFAMIAAACGDGDDEGTESGTDDQADAADDSGGSNNDAADDGDGAIQDDEPTGTGEDDQADQDDEDLAVGFAWTDTAIDVYKPLIAGAQEEAAARGYEVLESNNGGDPARQMADVQTWVAQGVTGVVILPLDPAATENIGIEAVEEGVIVVGYSDPIPGADGSTTFNHVQGGTDLGQHAADWINANLGGSARVGLLVIDEMAVGRDRIDSAMAVIEAQVEGVTIVGRQTAVSAADSLPVVQSFLQLDPEMNVVLCVADDGCIGAAQAYEAAGIDPAGVYMAGWDGALPALEQVRSNGYIKADAALDLKEIGRSVVYIVDDIRNGEGSANVAHDYVIVDANSGAVLDELIEAYG